MIKTGKFLPVKMLLTSKQTGNVLGMLQTNILPETKIECSFKLNVLNILYVLLIQNIPIMFAKGSNGMFP